MRLLRLFAANMAAVYSVHRIFPFADALNAERSGCLLVGGSAIGLGSADGFP